MHIYLVPVFMLGFWKIYTSDRKKEKTPSASMIKILKMNKIEDTKVI